MQSKPCRMGRKVKPDENSGSRRKLRIPVFCWTLQDGQRKGRGTEIITRDLSPQGFSFISRQIYPAETVLQADAYFPGSQRPMSCVVKISRRRALLGKDEYLIEASFHELKQEHQSAIQALLTKLDLYLILEQATKVGATDVHLTVGRPPMMRRDGRIVPMSTDVLEDGEIAAMVYPLLAEQQIRNLENRRELDFAFPPTLDSRFRVNAHWQRGFFEASLRNVPTKIKSFNELELPAEPLTGISHMG